MHAGQNATIPDDIQHNRTALVLYGSETGNAQDVAEELGRLTTKLHFRTVIIDLNSIDLRDILKCTITIFVVSTAGQGEFPQNARGFWHTLCSGALRSRVLKKLQFTSFGLGDSSYPRYNVAHRMLHGRLLQLGGNPFCERGEGDEQHPEGHAAGLRLWMERCKHTLLCDHPLPTDVVPLTDDVFMEPAFMLDRLASTAQHHVDAIKVVQNLTNEDSLLNSTPSTALLPVRHGHIAYIASNERLTPGQHFQDVRLLDLRIEEDLDYAPGAVADIYPKNFPEDVAHFISLMQWEHMLNVPLQVRAKEKPSTGITAPSPLRHLDLSQTTLTIEWLLENVLDIMAIPRRSFFAGLAQLCNEENNDQKYQKDRLLELADPMLIDELWDYTTRPKRTILEVMMDFTAVKIPWQYALSLIPIMRGRQFSIASGGELRKSTKGATRLQLLVAIVDPPSPIIKWRRRYGVCTRYIASLKAGQSIIVGLQPSQLGVMNLDSKQPVIMIGPGTGVAPLRSIIYQRTAWIDEHDTAHCDHNLAKDILFFGCRTATDDNFFKAEWARLSEIHGLKVITAFSRDQHRPKEYVQDKIRSNAQLVARTLVDDKAKVFVCGSSGNMPKGVRAALVDALCTHESLPTVSDAEAFLEDMERYGRYKQETW